MSQRSQYKEFHKQLHNHGYLRCLQQNDSHRGPCFVMTGGGLLAFVGDPTCGMVALQCSDGDTSLIVNHPQGDFRWRAFHNEFTFEVLEFGLLPSTAFQIIDRHDQEDSADGANNASCAP